MKIGFDGDILQIDDARIIFRNFAGEGSKFNREGDRNFAVVIPNDEIREQIEERGWVVKIRPPRDIDEEPFMYLPVKVKFNSRGPAIYVSSNSKPTKLNESTIGMLDEIDILSVSMDLRPYNWEVNGKEGISAYLHAMNVQQNLDRFGIQYSEEGLPF